MPRVLNVLVACEESQAVCKAFRRLGHRAYSCDIQDCSGGRPEWHIKGDARTVINGDCTFCTADTHTHTQCGRWDLIIAHPPCTYLTVSGNRWFDVDKYGKQAEERWRNRCEGAVFFMSIIAAECDHIAVENPVGIMGTIYRRADQIIQPYEFGHRSRKTTCLWLKGLPPLRPTEIVEPKLIEYQRADGSIATFSADYMENEDGKRRGYSDPLTAKLRSKTYQGIATAMAEQWSEFLLSDFPYEPRADAFVQYKLF